MRVVCIVLVALAASGTTVAWGEAREARLQVVAYVAPRVSLQTLEQPQAIELAAADLERGYRDVLLRYRVRTNASKGCVLRIATRGGIAEAIEVRGSAFDAVVATEPVDLHADGAGETEFRLTVRLRLDRELPPGRYPLPLHVAALVP
jgi:hypothetical protein